jgi:hypothetical protein
MGIKAGELAGVTMNITGKVINGSEELQQAMLLMRVISIVVRISEIRRAW